jgi:glycosyltransferase involved in cell wall biosynthesis
VAQDLDILFAELALLPCPGGAERFAFELMAELGQRHRVRALVAGEAGPVAALAALAAEVEVVAASSIARVLNEDPPDIVVSHLLAAERAIPAAREAGVPSLLLLAGYTALRNPSVDLATVVVAPSRALAAACGRHAEVTPPVVGAPPTARAVQTGPVVLAASMWTPQKGTQLVAPIAARLAPRPVVVRAPNGFPDDLEGLPNVTLDTSSSAISGVLDGAGALLVPSQGPEGFCRVAFEGMAAGVPTLASATGGLAELVPEQQLVRDYADPDGWAAAVERLEREAAWSAARTEGMRAAMRVLESDSPSRIERWLRGAVIDRARA